jgi:dihydrofolate reductase
MIKAILACDDAWGIGKDGTLPWPHNSADQSWFKKMTKGGVVVMGKNTWDDPDMPKPLPGRYNIVVTRGTAAGAQCVVPIDEVKKLLVEELDGHDNVWIIGGARLIKTLMPMIDQLWLSRIVGVYDCDTHLPEDNILKNYELVDVDTSIDTLSIETWSKL